MSGAELYAVGTSAEISALLADIAEAKTDVKEAKRAEERDIRDEVSACPQTFNTMGALRNNLYEEKKRLTAGTGEGAV